MAKNPFEAPAIPTEPQGFPPQFRVPSAAESTRPTAWIGRGDVRRKSNGENQIDTTRPWPSRSLWYSRKQNDLPESADRATWSKWAGRLRPRELEDDMQAFGMLLLAAATAGDGFGYTDPSAGHKHWLRSHVVTAADAPGTPPYTPASPAGARA